VGPFIPGLKDPLATIDGSRAVNVINTYVSAFFDKYLKDKDSSLLTGSVPIYPEVSLRVLGQ
jgi:hypothetical protein